MTEASEFWDSLDPGSSDADRMIMYEIARIRHFGLDDENYSGTEEEEVDKNFDKYQKPGQIEDLYNKNMMD